MSSSSEEGMFAVSKNSRYASVYVSCPAKRSFMCRKALCCSFSSALSVLLPSLSQSLLALSAEVFHWQLEPLYVVYAAVYAQLIFSLLVSPPSAEVFLYSFSSALSVLLPSLSQSLLSLLRCFISSTLSVMLSFPSQPLVSVVSCFVSSQIWLQSSVGVDADMLTIMRGATITISRSPN